MLFVYTGQAGLTIKVTILSSEKAWVVLGYSSLKETCKIYMNLF